MSGVTQSVAFRTRARTIDHLGREQIADVPTAVSELWKNAYDAYARAVSLHLYAGHSPAAAIFDDGHGMSRDDFVGRWLVVGTESKASGDATPAAQRNGLPERPRQGQKGIGRLSVAAIGSAVLVVSKAADGPFVAALLDWRIFENPFLLLEDVSVPVVEFDEPAQLSSLSQQLRNALLANIDGPPENAERAERLQAAWRTYDALERTREPGSERTSDRIRRLADAELPSLEPLADWSVWQDRATTGTALIMADVNPFLTAWVTGGAGPDSEETSLVKPALMRTLSGFSDPYSPDDLALDYRVVVHRVGDTYSVVARDPDYGMDFLEGLEHFVDGAFDQHGVFRGVVKAYGKDFGEVEYIPSQLPPTSPRDRPGPFKVTIGAFEPELKSSTLDPAVHAKIIDRAEGHSGLSVYRDGLRVMPYGRPENDFFKIEERRTSNAGREFWSSRRLFGRIAITRRDNPNLRDKAGREGLIDNTASRAMQSLMIDLLKRLARDFFGSASEVRKELLPGIEAENAEAAGKAKAVRKRTLNAFRTAVRERTGLLQDSLAALDVARSRLDAAIVDGSPSAIWAMGTPLDELASAKSELRLPPRPKTLGAFEKQYRIYRDDYGRFASGLDELRAAWRDEADRVQADPDPVVGRSHLGRNQKAVTDLLVRWRKDIGGLLASEQTRVSGRIDEDLKEFYKRAAPLVDGLESGSVSLSQALGQMDAIREQLTEQFAGVYEPYLRSVQQLSEGIDLDSVLTFSDSRQDTLEVQLNRVQALAQVGISVEILSHELQTLNRRLERGMNALPDDVRRLPAFETADEARRELVERLRFLSQMQISEGDVRRLISGEEIHGYVARFFERAIHDRKVSFDATAEFRAVTINDFPSRILPVFINLVNNALYWVSEAETRVIVLGVVDGAIYVSDTGPGVDPDDIPNLFELFFTRRIRGRGVGLYLCRQTLAAGGNTIDYVTDPEAKLLAGANFRITMRDGLDG